MGVSEKLDKMHLARRRGEDSSLFLRLVVRLSPLVFLFLTLIAPSESTHVVSALPEGATARFECTSERPAIWMKTDGNLLSFGEKAFDTSINPKKYSFTKIKNGNRNSTYVMTIKGVSTEDAGGYKCANVVNVTLLVSGRAYCEEPDVRRSIHEVRCSVAVGGRPRPKMFWSLGKDQYQGRESLEGDKLVSTFELTSSLEEHGKSLRCHVDYGFYWNSTEPQPSCGWPKINVHFGPKLICPSVEAIRMDAPFFDLECKALANPPMDPSAIDWSLAGVSLSPEEKRHRMSLTRIRHGFRVRLRLDGGLFHSSSHSVDAVSRQLTVTANGRHHTAMKVVTLRVAFGPAVLCPDKVYIKSWKTSVSCDILSFPLPAVKDIEWNFIVHNPPVSSSAAASAAPRSSGRRHYQQNYTFIQDLELIEGGERVTLRLNATHKAHKARNFFGWDPTLKILRLRVGDIKKNISLVHVNFQASTEKQPLINTATFVTLSVISSIFVGITFLIILLMYMRTKYLSMRRRRALDRGGRNDNMWHLTSKKSPLNLIYS